MSKKKIDKVKEVKSVEKLQPEGDLNAARVAECVNVVKKYRMDFKAANNGPEVLAAVDKRIDGMNKIFETARDAYIESKNSFEPGSVERQPVEVKIQGMSRDLRVLKAARDALAALLG